MAVDLTIFPTLDEKGLLGGIARMAGEHGYVGRLPHQVVEYNVVGFESRFGVAVHRGF